MTMLKKALLATAITAAALTTAGTASAATLIGDTVTINLTGNGINAGTQTVTVGAGEEGNYFNNQFFDFGANSFSIRSIANYTGIYGSGTNVLTLGSLDLGSPITGVTFSSVFSGVSVAYTATSATFTWTDQAIPATTYLTATFQSAVPEPASWAMMILGMGAVGFAMRAAKRKSKVSTSVRFA